MGAILLLVAVQRLTILSRLYELSRDSSVLESRPLQTLSTTAGDFEFPAFVFNGSGGGGDPLRLGFFSGYHADDPAGVLALIRLLEHVAKNPALAEGYRLFIYPACNPSGLLAGTRFSQHSKDLNREFWKNSSEPEVQWLENEIRSECFHGLVSLHADDTSNGIYGFIRGAVLSKGLLEPALKAAESILPRNTKPIIDGFPAVNGIISECYDGILTSPPELHPQPFEIILETPHLAPQEQQVKAFVRAMETVLHEYRELLAFAANL